MTTLFQAENRQGFLVNIDLEQSFLKEVLWQWLKAKHSEIYWDIEMHEGGSKLSNAVWQELKKNIEQTLELDSNITDVSINYQIKLSESVKNYARFNIKLQ